MLNDALLLMDDSLNEAPTVKAEQVRTMELAILKLRQTLL
jgi:hypothetical protein